MRIIIVEDEIKIREGMGKLIESLTDHIVLGEASDGEEGLDLVLRFKPDLVITDIRMPVMDVCEAARRIRALGRPDTDRVPIIAMTANAFSEDVKQSLDSGMNAHIAKPVEPQKLYQILCEYLLAPI